MALLDELLRRRLELLSIFGRYRASNPRIFGSVARGEETAESDIDLLVDLPDALTLFDVAALQLDLEAALQRHVDLVTEREIHRRIKPQVLNEAVAL